MRFPYPVGPYAVPLFLAPMAGVSESPFRRLCRRHGADVVVTEFLSAEGIRRENEATIAKLRFGATVGGDLTKFGLRRPAHKPGQSHPVQSEKIREQLAAGAITARPAIERLDGDRVVFVDGTSAPADLIIWATGYKVSFPFLKPDLVSVEDNELPLWKRTVVFAGLLAIGFAALGVAPNLLIFCVLGFFAGATVAPTITNTDTVVQRSVARDQITEGMAWLRIGIGIGVAGGAWAAGWLIQEMGARQGLYFAAGAAILTFGIAVACIPLLKRTSDRDYTPESVTA